jgi:hypothetical protein
MPQFAAYVVERKKERFAMVIVFVGFGIVFGALAGGLTLVSGGSILLAVAAYSGAGTVSALAATFYLMFFSKTAVHASQRQEKKESGPLPA